MPQFDTPNFSSPLLPASRQHPPPPASSEPSLVRLYMSTSDISTSTASEETVLPEGAVRMGGGGELEIFLDAEIPDMDRGEEEEELADATLIGDEVEPSVMREADEFSQFEPTHLASMLNRESFLRSIRPPVTAGQESTTTSQAQPVSVSATAISLSRSLPSSSAQTVQPLATNLSFPASVDRYGVLHGELKVSEQIRPTVEGFTERDEVDPSVDPSTHRTTDHLPQSEKLKEAGTRVGVMLSEGYFTDGQPSEFNMSELRAARQDTGMSHGLVLWL